MDNFFEATTLASAEVKVKKERKPREKKVKLTSLQKKCNKIKTLMGKLTGSFGIIKIPNGRYLFILRHIPRGSKKEKIKKLFSSPNLELIQKIGNALSEELKFPYNHNPIEKEAKERIKKYDGFEIDHSIFKIYNGKPFIFLPFGSLFLEENNFHPKRNSEKIDGNKILDLYSGTKFQAGFTKCIDILKSFDDYKLSELMKEVMHFGDSDDRNSIRLALGKPPLVATCDEEGSRIYMKELA